MRSPRQEAAPVASNTETAEIIKLFTAKLALSGITEEQAAALGMKPMLAKTIKSMGYWKDWGGLPALCIPYLDPWTRKPVFRANTAMHRVRCLRKPEAPPQDFARYLQPAGTGAVAYFPPTTKWPKLLADPRQPLVITEGELKAAKACLAGFPTIGIGGVWNFRNGKALLPELLQIKWTERAVYIAFDSDAAVNPQIGEAMRVLSNLLIEQGALPFQIALPDMIHGGKTGLDDLLTTDDGPAALRKLIESAEPLSFVPDLPRIRVTAGLRHEAVDAGLAALVAARVGFYQRGTKLVRCASVPAKASDGQVVQVPGVVTIASPYLERELGKAAVWERVNQSGPHRINPPAAVANEILAMEGEWPFPPLRGVISTQTMRADGTLLRAEGYDEATGYYLLAPPAMQQIPEHPTQRDALRSLARLDELLKQFPFVDQESHSVGLSMLMTPVLRAAMLVAPCHAVVAPESGTGKSYQCDVAAMIATGNRCAVISLQSPEEAEKRLIGAALSGEPIIALDNLTIPLEGDFLCQLTERPQLRLRPLGTSDMSLIPNSFSIFANGNNLTIADMASRGRTLRCSLDANVEDTTKIRYASPSPTERIAADRGSYVADVLIIARAYAAAGYPGLLTLPSFEGWSKFVRSPLVWLGRADPTATIATLREEDPGRKERTAVFSAWEEELGLSKVGLKTSELVEAANEYHPHTKARPGLHEAFIAVAGVRSMGEMEIDPLRLGQWLNVQKDTFANGLKLSINNADKKRPRWVLSRKYGEGPGKAKV